MSCDSSVDAPGGKAGGLFGGGGGAIGGGASIPVPAGGGGGGSNLVPPGGPTPTIATGGPSVTISYQAGVGEPPPTEPQTKEDCKNGGWKQFGFNNQGACIKAVNPPS